MSQPFLLCDPGLLIPPAETEADSHQQFWVRLVAWSADRRVKLGVEGRAAVLQEVGRTGWPDATPPSCPAPLCRDARKAISRLLATTVAADAYKQPAVQPTMDPAYTRGQELGDALALDICGDSSGRLAGAASTAPHWSRRSDGVRLTPGPADEVPLLHDASQRSAREVDLAVAAALKDRRVTIVGGKRLTRVVDELCVAFSLRERQIRWIEAERDGEPNVDPLKGARGDKEIVFCVTGAIGHSGSTRTLDIARRRGVRVLCVETVSSISDGLRTLLGPS